MYDQKNELTLRQKGAAIYAAMQADACIITSPVSQYWLSGFVFDGYLSLPEVRLYCSFGALPVSQTDVR